MNRTTLFLDCEYNGFGGELLSIALWEPRTQKAFYRGVLLLNPVLDPWVRENVMPVMGTTLNPRHIVQDELQGFLNAINPAHIVADWPEDIMHFCQLLLVGPGKCLFVPPMTFELFPCTYTSAIPHNALEDAKGIAVEYLKQAR